MKALVLFLAMIAIATIFPGILSSLFSADIHGGIVIIIVVGAIILSCLGGTDRDCDLR